MATSTPHRLNSPEADVCPYCGQPLLNDGAVRHLHESELEAQRTIEAAATAKAAQLAKQMTVKQEQRVARAEARLVDERTKHADQLRKLRIDVRAKAEADAARAAEARVKGELRAQERAIKSFKEQIEVQQRQIEHLTSDERGEVNELTLVAELQAAFPDDRIERTGRGRAGGDILHHVCVPAGDRLREAGLIVYECKDTKSWSNAFLDQARREGETHGTRYLVIVTRAFPRGEKILAVRNGVVVVHPTRVVDMARIMRRMVEEVDRVGMTANGQEAKTAALYEYLTSLEFRQAFGAVAADADVLAGLLGKEREVARAGVVQAPDRLQRDRLEDRGHRRSHTQLSSRRRRRLETGTGGAYRMRFALRVRVDHPREVTRERVMTTPTPRLRRRRFSLPGLRARPTAGWQIAPFSTRHLYPLPGGALLGITRRAIPRSRGQGDPRDSDSRAPAALGRLRTASSCRRAGDVALVPRGTDPRPREPLRLERDRGNDRSRCGRVPRSRPRR